MPIVQISLVEGRSATQLRSLIREVTKAVARSLDAPVETVKIVLSEIPATHWGSGELTIAEKRNGDAARGSRESR